MSDFVPRILDGLTALTRELLDNASQHNWLQIENPDNGREPPEARPRTDRPSPQNTQPQPKAGAKQPPYSPPPAKENKAPVSADKSGTGDTAKSEISAQPYPLPASPIAGALRENRNGEKLRHVQLATPAVVGAPPARTQIRPVLTTATNMSPLSQARIGGSDPAAVKVERILVSAGAQMAAQELHAAVRSLPASEISLFLDNSSALVASVLEKSCGDLPAGKVDEKQRTVRTALAVAHLSAAIDKDPRSPSTMRLMQDIGSVVLASATPNDNTVFTGLAQAIGAGAGIKLALMVAAALAHEEGERRSRAPSLRALMVAGFSRLGERVDEAHRAVLQCLGPLLMDWASWRAARTDAALIALVDFVGSQPNLIENLAPRLDRIEQVGVEALRVLRDLASSSLDDGLRSVQQQFIASESVFGSIAASRTALREINQIAALRMGGENAKVELDAIKLVLTDIGFDAPRAAFLADRSRIDHGAMLAHNWTALENFAHMEAHGRLFQQLLAFLNGQYIIEYSPALIGFDDLDPSSMLIEL
ncbi:hypothetical protein AAIB41_15890 [Brucella sp. BE17]|uniref:hypothetical protein n=1 Tax=Brucella sp. BE17 TaxID=3142977 RepID=UPI0031BB5145